MRRENIHRVTNSILKMNKMTVRALLFLISLIFFTNPHIHNHAYTCKNVHTRARTHAHRCVHTHVHVYTHTYTYTRARSRKHTCTYILVHTPARACTNTRERTHKRAQTHKIQTHAQITNITHNYTLISVSVNRVTKSSTLRKRVFKQISLGGGGVIHTTCGSNY